MFDFIWKQTKAAKRQPIDRLADELLCSGEVSEEEIAAAANAPFLQRRILVQIEEEKRRQSEAAERWLMVVRPVRYAVAAMIVIAITAISGMVYLKSQLSKQQLASRKTPNERRERVPETQLLYGVSALSNDEVLLALMGWNTNEKSRGKDEAAK